VPPPPAWVSIGIGDDAAVLEPVRGRSEVVTTDVLVEGVHFDLRYVPPEAVGSKALAVNLSDLAAMGAEPRAALLSLVLPASLPVEDLDAVVSGLLDLAHRYGVALVGGNMARSPGPLVVDVTAVGSVKARRVLRRGGAAPGDAIYVSGSAGAARAGFLALRAGVAGVPGADEGLRSCCERFLRPDPRVRLGLLLGRTDVASACVDSSDGLADAVRQIAAESRVGAIVVGEDVPIDDAAARWFAEREGVDPLEAALGGGEDYELVFTVPRRRRRALEAVLRSAGIPACARIGTVTRGAAVLLRRAAVDGPMPTGFTHFR
jgi:thiamine-monophosphate kinase